jgi:hypothetical protein
VGFSWSFTRETLLACELSELDRLLAGRQEVLAMLHPLSSSRVARMMGLTAAGLPQQQQQQATATAAASTGAAAAAAEPQGLVLPSPPQEQQQQQPEAALADDEGAASCFSDDGGDTDAESIALLPMMQRAAADAQQAAGSSSAVAARRSCRDDSGSGRPSIISCPDVFAGLNLGLADSSVVSLEVGVVEVSNLAPRSGWSQDLTHALLSSAAAGVACGADSSSASTVLMETAKREDLPLPVVYVFCGAGGPGDKGFEVRRAESGRVCVAVSR